MSNVLLTGGAGFIGRHVNTRLLAEGHRVTILDSLRPDVHEARFPTNTSQPSQPRDPSHGRRLDPSARWSLPVISTPQMSEQKGPIVANVEGRKRLLADQDSQSQLVVGDVRDADTVAAVLQDVDVVVHLAAKVGLGVDLDDMNDYVSSNCLGTAVLLRAMAGRSVPRLVLASSMVIYGEGRYDCREHGPVTPGPRSAEALAAGRFEPPCPHCGEPLTPGLVGEDATPDPRNTYAATKLHGEHLAATWARETGGTATALRFHNVYGPGMPRDTPYAGVAAIFRSALENGKAPRVFEDGGQRRDFVHVTDVAAAVARAVAVPAPEPFAAYNVGTGTVHTIGDLATLLSTAYGGPPPIVTGDFRVGDVRHITASSDLIHTTLGWQAEIDLPTGITDLLNP